MSICSRHPEPERTDEEPQSSSVFPLLEEEGKAARRLTVSESVRFGMASEASLSPPVVLGSDEEGEGDDGEKGSREKRQ
jgi:hypothetical protein